MEFSVPSWAIYLTAAITLCAGILKLFQIADENSNQIQKNKVSEWIRNAQGTLDYSWPTIFREAFDNVFGSKHVSFRCFKKSALVTIATSTFALIFLMAVTGEYENISINFILGFGFIIVILNIIPDYISLLETRWLLGRIREKHALNHIVVLFFDALVSIAIIFLAFSFLTIVQEIIYVVIHDRFFSLMNIQNAISNIPSLFRDLLFLNMNNTDLTAFFITFYSSIFTSLVTSIWLYLIIVGGYIHRLIVLVSPVIFYIDYKEKPMTAIGWICVLLVAATFAIAALLSTAKVG